MSTRYRFVELYYRRSKAKGRTIPGRVETVVIYLPDVRSCVPTRIEWDALHASYKTKMEFVIKQETEGRNANDGGTASPTSLAVVKSQATTADGAKEGGGTAEKGGGAEDAQIGGDANESAGTISATNEKAQQFLFYFIVI